MKYCNNCHAEFRGVRCPTCGEQQHRAPAPAGVSVTADSLDSLVQEASVPNLADLFRKAKATGVITPGQEYGSSS